MRRIIICILILYFGLTPLFSNDFNDYLIEFKRQPLSEKAYRSLSMIASIYYGSTNYFISYDSEKNIICQTYMNDHAYEELYGIKKPKLDYHKAIKEQGQEIEKYSILADYDKSQFTTDDEGMHFRVIMEFGATALYLLEKEKFGFEKILKALKVSEMEFYNHIKEYNNFIDALNYSNQKIFKKYHVNVKFK